MGGLTLPVIAYFTSLRFDLFRCRTSVGGSAAMVGRGITYWYI